MPSATYELFRRAMLQQTQVVCSYDGYPRRLCPVILGRSAGQEKVLAYQVGGSGSRGLPPGGAWKCLFVARVQGATLGEGRWREGTGHAADQTCVAQVELDINIHVRRRSS